MDPLSNSNLQCPVCHLPLKQTSVGSRNVWACDRCLGRAVSVELLRRVFTPESVNPIWAHAIKGQGKTGVGCPVCHKPMLEVKPSDAAEVKVDVCQHCHFVWFDAGETQNLVARAAPAQPPPLPQKARETMALFEVQQLAEKARRSDFQPATTSAWWTEIALWFFRL